MADLSNSGGGGGGGNGGSTSPTATAPSTATPGIVPAALPPPQFNFPGGAINPYPYKIGDGMISLSPLDPTFSTYFANWLGSQIGRGATPFDLSALLPSSGGATQAGQLSAPLTELIQQLQNFYQGGSSNIPGLNTLANVASQGISAVPTWQTMVDAMQRNIGENAANLKEQFNAAGGLASSPYGTAVSDYYSQTAKDEGSTLAQLQYQGIQDQLGASQFLAQGAGNLGQYLQGLDQDSIDRLYKEFIRTRPEYNPLLQMEYGQANTFPPVYGKGVGGGTAGAIASGAGSIADIIGILAGL